MMATRLALVVCLCVVVAGPIGCRAQGAVVEAIRQRFQDPSGFSVKVGFGLGAEVDDIEGEVDFGPFGFTLDPLPPPKKSAPAKKPPAPPACNEFCDQYLGTTCCMDELGVCVPNGGTCPVAFAGHHTGFHYGRKLKEARDLVK